MSYLSPVLVEVTRNGVVESQHRGSFVVLEPSGNIALSGGSVLTAMYPRSANKPMQAVGMVEAGLNLPPRLLALAAASHSGEAMHLTGVRDILSGAGLTESDLHNSVGLPYDAVEAAEVLGSGKLSSRLLHNCSGKHAAMLSTCVSAGWPIQEYLHHEHPVQQVGTTAIQRLAGDSIAQFGIDGCGAPAHQLSLLGLARSFQRIAVSPNGPEREVADAMREFPEMVAGSRRDVTRIMKLVPGMLCKDGAEGVMVAAMDNGWSVALKFDDGALRGRMAVVVRLFRAVDIPVPDTFSEAVLGGDQIVGEVRAIQG